MFPSLIRWGFLWWKESPIGKKTSENIFSKTWSINSTKKLWNAGTQKSGHINKFSVCVFHSVSLYLCVSVSDSLSKIFNIIHWILRPLLYALINNSSLALKNLVSKFWCMCVLYAERMTELVNTGCRYQISRFHKYL